MITRTKLIGLGLGSLLLCAGTGCVFARLSPQVWTEATEELRIETAGLTTLEVRTHNGAITHTARSDEASTAIVTITKKGGGVTQAGAEEALAAIQVYSEPADDGLHRIGWKWAVKKHSGWGAKVSFEIHAPANLAFDGQTHNGRIKVAGVNADVRVITHNGRLNISARGGKLYAKTHNGRVEVVYAGENVTVVTHNGRIVADLSGCAAVGGSIKTHNGGIELALGEAASTRLKCQTHNGAVSVDVPLRDIESSRGKLTGVLGDGKGDLAVRTHNGSIKIKKAAG